MDAPLYLPAAAYEQPASLPQALSMKTSTIAEILEEPEARKILDTTVPGLTARAEVPGLVPHRRELSFYALMDFGVVGAEDLAKVEPRLTALNVRRGVKP